MGINIHNEDGLLTTEEVLGYLQVNLRTVYRLIKSGRIPAARVGRLWRFRKRDIDAWLDAERPPGHPATLAATTRGRTARSRVLVVDDDPSVREVMKQALAEYDVDTAADGQAAIERLRAGPCDLLITDLKMPRMDGLTLIREAKRLSADVPVIIITGVSSESSAIEAVNLGVKAYLTKPFQLRQVVEAAARVLGR